MASLVKVQYCIECAEPLENGDTLVYCDNCDFELDREDALATHVEKIC